MRILPIALAIAFVAPAAEAEDGPFSLVGSLPVYKTLFAGQSPATQTVAEIADVSADGKRLYFTDSPNNALVSVDISDAAAPLPLARIEVGGEPTSLVVAGGQVLVAVNTSASFKEPSGHVAVYDAASGTITARCDVAGQPDSIAVSPDKTFAMVAVENERNEGLNGGDLPQYPGGHAVIFELGKAGVPKNCDGAKVVALSGLAQVAGDDAEPEYVSINADNKAVLTLQENNHLVVVDLVSGDVEAHFSAGSVDLTNVPVSKKKRGDLQGLRREPDTVVWLDTDRFVTANEGDYVGGSRGFSIWSKDGRVLYDSGELMETLALEMGVYPFKRAKKKGTEPEGVAVGEFGGEKLIFVNSERADFIAVFRDTGAAPEFVQFLPSPPKPEGMITVPARGLLIVTSEQDNASKGVRAAVNFYKFSR